MKKDSTAPVALRSSTSRRSAPSSAEALTTSHDVPVTGVLCFVDSDWPLLNGTFTTRGVEVLWPKKLYPRLKVAGPYAEQVAALHQALAAALPLA